MNTSLPGQRGLRPSCFASTVAMVLDRRTRDPADALQQQHDVSRCAGETTWRRRISPRRSDAVKYWTNFGLDAGFGSAGLDSVFFGSACFVSAVKRRRSRRRFRRVTPLLPSPDDVRSLFAVSAPPESGKPAHQQDQAAFASGGASPRCAFFTSQSVR
jgi:hypothetical protein